MVTVAGVAAALIRMLSFVGGPVGPLRGSGLGLGVRPVFSKTGIDSDRDDGFNSVAVAAAVWYEL